MSLASCVQLSRHSFIFAAIDGEDDAHTMVHFIPKQGQLFLVRGKVVPESGKFVPTQDNLTPNQEKASLLLIKAYFIPKNHVKQLNSCVPRGVAQTRQMNVNARTSKLQKTLGNLAFSARVVSQLSAATTLLSQVVAGRCGRAVRLRWMAAQLAAAVASQSLLRHWFTIYQGLISYWLRKPVYIRPNQGQEVVPKQVQNEPQCIRETLVTRPLSDPKSSYHSVYLVPWHLKIGLITASRPLELRLTYTSSRAFTGRARLQKQLLGEVIVHTLEEEDLVRLGFGKLRLRL